MFRKILSIFENKPTDEMKDEFEDEVCESCGEWYGDCGEENCGDEDCESSV